MNTSVQEKAVGKQSKWYNFYHIYCYKFLERHVPSYPRVLVLGAASNKFTRSIGTHVIRLYWVDDQSVTYRLRWIF